MNESARALFDARELATHAAEIKHLQDDMNKLVTDMEEIKLAIQQIQSTLAEAKGGWRTLVYAAGIGSAITSAVAWIVTHWVK